jgi:von Willebrand factor type A domain
MTCRRALRSAAIATVAGACAVLAQAASADITGVVRSTSGTPLARVYVEATDATGERVTSDTTSDTGDYTLQLFGPAAFPLTVTYEYDDPCAQTPDQTLTTAQPAAADGTVLPAPLLPAHAFCTESPSVFGRTAPPPSAIVDGDAARIISPAGGIAYLRLPLPYDATGVTVLYDGVAIGGQGVTTFTAYATQITAPATSGSGTLTASYQVDGTLYSLRLGTMIVVGATPPPPAAAAGIDIEVAIDISGSMSGTDPSFVRKDAMRALLGLVGRSDRLGALGFDDQFEPIFALQPVTDANSEALARLADEHILTRGATDYNVAFTKGYEALTTPGVYDPARPKYVIFLTDGGQNSGVYANGHLRLAANPSGRPWPVCAVQFGSDFAAADVTRLQRIASETGGRFLTARANGNLADTFRRCLRGATSQRTIVDTNVTITGLGKPKRVARTLGPKVDVARFFISFTPGGGLTPVLIDPKGIRVVPGRNVSVRRGDTFSLFRVLRPRPGKWSVVMTPAALVAGSLSANVSVTVPRK